MNLSKNAYKGCRDLFPVQKRELNFLFNKMQQTANLYAYEPYDGPLLESVDLYKAKSGEELINDQIYSFTDRGDRFVAIRPEMTPTLARMIAQVHKEASKPIRWYSIPNLMRYEKPQRGRLREHWQFNCDIFGAPEVLGELEILGLAKDLLTGFGATQEHFEILINDRDIVQSVFEKLNVSDEQSYKLFKIIDKAKKVSQEALSKMLDEVLDSQKKDLLTQYLSLNNFEDLMVFLDKNEMTRSGSRITKLLELGSSTNLKPFLSYDPTIVRGLDYYTGIVFEIFDKHPDNRRAICGGGAYANLLEIFKEQPLPGIGFGLGDVTLTDFLKTHNLMPSFEKTGTTIYINFSDEALLQNALKASELLRKNSISTETTLQPQKFNKGLKIAQKKGVQYFLTIEDDQKISLNEIATKRKVETSLEQLEKEIKELL